MKITITSKNKVNDNTVTLETIKNKLNEIADNSRLFNAFSNEIIFGDNCNCDCHTKLILIFGLFLNNYNGKYGSFISFNLQIATGSFFFGSMPLQKAMDFLNSLGEIEKVKVDFEA